MSFIEKCSMFHWAAKLKKLYKRTLKADGSKKRSNLVKMVNFAVSVIQKEIETYDDSTRLEDTLLFLKLLIEVISEEHSKLSEILPDFDDKFLLIMEKYLELIVFQADKTKSKMEWVQKLTEFLKMLPYHPSLQVSKGARCKSLLMKLLAKHMETAKATSRSTEIYPAKVPQGTLTPQKDAVFAVKGTPILPNSSDVLKNHLLPQSQKSKAALPKISSSPEEDHPVAGLKLSSRKRKYDEPVATSSPSNKTPSERSTPKRVKLSIQPIAKNNIDEKVNLHFDKTPNSSAEKSTPKQLKLQRQPAAKNDDLKSLPSDDKPSSSPAKKSNFVLSSQPVTKNIEDDEKTSQPVTRNTEDDEKSSQPVTKNIEDAEKSSHSSTTKEPALSKLVENIVPVYIADSIFGKENILTSPHKIEVLTEPLKKSVSFQLDIPAKHMKPPAAGLLSLSHLEFMLRRRFRNPFVTVTEEQRNNSIIRLLNSKRRFNRPIWNVSVMKQSKPAVRETIKKVNVPSQLVPVAVPSESTPAINPDPVIKPDPAIYAQYVENDMIIEGDLYDHSSEDIDSVDAETVEMKANLDVNENVVPQDPIPVSQQFSQLQKTLQGNILDCEASHSDVELMEEMEFSAKSGTEAINLDDNSLVPDLENIAQDTPAKKTNKSVLKSPKPKSSLLDSTERRRSSRLASLNITVTPHSNPSLKRKSLNLEPDADEDEDDEVIITSPPKKKSFTQTKITSSFPNNSNNPVLPKISWDALQKFLPQCWVEILQEHVRSQNPITHVHYRANPGQPVPLTLICGCAKNCSPVDQIIPV